MTWDIATDPNTGDWLFSANRDLQAAVETQVVAQRIRNRLRIVRGSWPLDPSDGALGSDLAVSLHSERGRAIREAPLAVREALAPMDDISILNVSVEEGARSLTIVLEYVVTQEEDFNSMAERVSETLLFEIPA